MPARLNAFPSYVVFDLSFIPTITLTPTDSGGTISATGGNNWRDSDLTTYAQYQNTNANIGVGGEEILYDFGKIMSNAILSYKIDFDGGGAHNIEAWISYSIDGANWTDLSDDGSVLNITKTNSTFLTAYAGEVRYIRLKIIHASDTNKNTIKVYELRLMGSGK